MEVGNVTAMGEEAIKREETKLEMTLEEVLNTLSSVSLASVTIGDSLVVMRSDFDLTISGEPYIGLVLLLNLKTGKYFSRIWNQTVTTGIIAKECQLMEACENLFGQGRPCLGCPEGSKHEYVKQGCLTSHTPIPRRIATTCIKVLGKDAHASVSSCSECMKLSKLGGRTVNNFDEEVKNPPSLSQMNRDSEFLTSFKTEYMDEYLDEDWNKCVTKFEILQSDAFQEAGSIDCREDNNATVQHQNKEQREGTMNHVCRECGYATSRKGHLKKHIEAVHEKIKNHVCQECGYAASRLDSLKKHIEAKHENKKNYVCGECGYAASQKNHLTQHIEVVHKKIKKWVCKECGYAASQKVHLKVHIEAVHEKVKNHVCKECGYAATRLDTLKHHIEGAHNAGGKKFKCEKCPFVTPWRSTFTTHFKRMHGKRDNVCEDCGYATALKRDLKTHIEGVHKNIKSHICEECGYAASRKETLQIHIERVHEKIKNHLCEECGHAASHKKDLRKHIETVHKKIKDHVCSECQFAASCMGNLKRHIEGVHEKIRHPCGQCGQAFSQKGDLKRHIAKVHDNLKRPVPQIAKKH